MRLINKAGLLAGALTTLLILASCSDSDTSTGVTTGKQLANDSSTEVVMHQGTAGEGEHSNPDTNHGHSPEQQHAEPNNPTTSSVVALLSISNPSCGNFSQEDGEQCDGGLGGNATCNTDCTLKTLHGEVIATAACGNGIVDPGEQCDDANDSNEDDCTQYCKTPVCGDGYVQGSNGEQCDDKNRIDSDGCNNACQSSTTTVVTTTTVIEQVNDDGGTTRTTTTTTPPDTTPTATTVIEEVNDDGGTTRTISEGCHCEADANGHSQYMCDLQDPPQPSPGLCTPMNHECTTTQSCRDLGKANHSCEAVGRRSHAIRQCVAQTTTLPPGAGMETNCTFAPMANSDHDFAVTYNIGDEWTYTCNPGFHLDGRENSITSQSNFCVEGSRYDREGGSASCVQNDVNCNAEYTSCRVDAELEETRVYAACQTFQNDVFFDISRSDKERDNYCTMEGITARTLAYIVCSSELNSCRG